jgi:GNAT superfamily N-acetyltransferase
VTDGAGPSGPRDLARLPGVEIRSATVSDVRAIARVHVDSWQAAYRGQIPEDYLQALSVDSRERVWRELIADARPPREQILVALDEGSLVGFAGTCPSRDPDATPAVGELGSIYVAPEHWSRSVGRVLLEAALNALADAGFSTATLWVLDTNRRARRFYEAAGWTEEGMTKVDRRPTFTLTEVRYHLQLATERAGSTP